MDEFNNMQLQWLDGDYFANQTVQNELNIIDDFQVSAAPNLVSFPVYFYPQTGVDFYRINFDNRYLPTEYPWYPIPRPN